MKTIKILLIAALTSSPLAIEAQVLTLKPDNNMEVYSFREGAGDPEPLPANIDKISLRRVQQNPNLAALLFDFQGASWNPAWNVTSVTLTLTVNSVPSDVLSTGSSSTIYARAISGNNTAWAPGLSTSNYQDWNNGVDPRPLWEEKDGDPVPAGANPLWDAAQTWDLLGSENYVFFPSTPQFTEISMNLSAATIEGWLTNPTSFNGLLLLQEGPDTLSSTQYFAKDSTHSGLYSPQLDIQYAVPEPATTTALLVAFGLYLAFGRSKRGHAGAALKH